jgi:hypothetical protein
MPLAVPPGGQYDGVVAAMPDARDEMSICEGHGRSCGSRGSDGWLY